MEGEVVSFKVKLNWQLLWFPEASVAIIVITVSFEIKVPIVIRLAGTNVEKGNKILKDSKLKYIEASTLEDAANKAVKALGDK